jgi:hypothetical protein
MRWVASLTWMSAFCRAVSGRVGTPSGASALLAVDSGLCGCVVAMGLVLRERFNSVDSFCGMLGVFAYIWLREFMETAVLTERCLFK